MLRRIHQIAKADRVRSQDERKPLADDELVQADTSLMRVVERALMVIGALALLILLVWLVAF